MNVSDPHRQGSQARAVVSALRQQYQVVLPGGARPHPAAKRLDFSSADAASRLLRNELNLGDSYWRSVLRSHFPSDAGRGGDSHGPTFYLFIASLVVRGKIGIYKLPTLQNALLAKDGKGKAFRFVKGPDPLPAVSAELQHFNDDHDIESLLKATRQGEDFWAAVLEDSGTAPPGYQVARSCRELVKAKLRSGELRAYAIPYEAPRAASKAEFEALSALLREVPLAPENSTGYVELKLLYDDDSPIANQKYWVRDCEGKEYTGTTDANGTATLKGLPSGSCEISFPDLDGWE